MMAETPSQPLAEKTELQILVEENDVMRREIEALLQAKEIAREKVRVRSQPQFNNENVGLHIN